MFFKNLRDFAETLEKNKELKRVNREVDCNLEITEITDRISKQSGPALLFENVKGYKFPVLINVFGSKERMSCALGVNNLDEIGERIEKLVNTDLPEGFTDKIRTLFELSKFAKYSPKLVKDAPCQEIVDTDGQMLDGFPILKCWPLDGGRFITLPIVVTKNPETGKRNAGMYRMQVYDKKTTGMHWHSHKDGARHYRSAEERKQKLEVAVALGGDPVTIYSATAPLPEGIDEFVFSGFLRDEPVELVKCRTVDLEVPAESEIIIEGYVEPYERRKEGRFGDHTGFYSEVGEYPVFHVNCVTYRKDAIYPATIVGRPPMEDCFFGKATERIFLPVIKKILPEIVDMNLPVEGVFHNCAIISIKKEYAGHAKKVMNFLWGMGQMMFTKTIIIVDSDVDVHNISETAWKAFNLVEPKNDLLVTEGPVDVLNVSSNVIGYGSKLGVDATKKLPEEGMTRGYEKEIEMDKDVVDLVTKNWKEYGF